MNRTTQQVLVCAAVLAAGLVGRAAPGAVDLAPYKPGAWNDKIPIGVTQLGGTATHSYTGPYPSNQVLYWNCAVANYGTTAAGSFTIHFEVTGTGGGSWDILISSLDYNHYTYRSNDVAVGPLAAGSHTFKIWSDYYNTVTESDETNNYYERTITVVNMPDLTPGEPSNWSYRVPIGTTQLAGTADHTYTAPYRDNQTLYFNWSSLNSGAASAGGYQVHAEVTGTGGGSWDWNIAGNAPGESQCLANDQAAGPLAVGSHTFKVWVDHDNAVAEGSETNNYYERSIYVSSSLVEYYVECADNSGFTSPRNSGWIQSAECTFGALTLGQTYWYRAKARRSGTESGWSNVEHSQQQPHPSVLVLNPAQGPAAGGTAVTVTGTGFVDGATVTFATATVTAEFIGVSELHCTTPPGPVGPAVDVTVRNLNGGTGTLSPGFTYFGNWEADVAPRQAGGGPGGGDDDVSVADWVEIGRFAAKLDTPVGSVEFQKADCAGDSHDPPVGDGDVSVADWVKCGRYAAKLDAKLTAQGPTGP